MICFEIALNGEKLATTGMTDFGVMTTTLMYTNLKVRPGNQFGDEDSIVLRAGGLISSDNSSPEWIDRKLEIGIN
jgi:hypothetical protein